MQEAVAILSNTSATQQQLGSALEALRHLVEPIDNANSEDAGLLAYAPPQPRHTQERGLCEAKAHPP